MGRGSLLFPSALGISAAVHLLLLFLWPYAPARPAQEPPEPIPVRLVQAPRPALQPTPKPALQPAAARPAAQSLAAEQTPAPVAQPVVPLSALPQTVPEPQAQPPAEAPLELAPPVAPQTALAEASPGSAPGEAAGLQSGAGSGPSAELAAEVAATQAVLTSLRSRIVEKIRYPALARANGWKGTVLMELLLDERGALEALAVRRSSGYAVLDRAASALVRSVTPVPNPLGRSLRIEVPIVYELRE